MPHYSFFFHNRIEDKKAGENAEKTLQQLEDAITEREAKDETDTTRAPDVSSSPGMPSPPERGAARTVLPAPPALDMPTVHSGAYDYIGYLDFPGYGLTMPVAATWSFPALEISPVATPAACTMTILLWRGITTIRILAFCSSFNWATS